MHPPYTRATLALASEGNASGKRRSETHGERGGEGQWDWTWVNVHHVAPRPVQIIRTVRSNHGFLRGSFPPRGHRVESVVAMTTGIPSRRVRPA